jgi:GntR family transcriptional regulator
MIHPDYKSGKSLHEQIGEEIRQHIISGILAPDEQIPSVREMALALTVNPNTVQRAYKQLEQDGFIYSIKGKGNFVARLPERVSSEKLSELYAKLSDVARELAFLGEEKEKLLSAIEKTYEEKEESL